MEMLLDIEAATELLSAPPRRKGRPRKYNQRCRRLRPIERDIKDAEARVAELQQTQTVLEKGNQLLKAKLQVLPAQIIIANEAVLHDMVPMTFISKQSMQLAHTQEMYEASFMALPPPEAWISGSWSHFLRTMSPDQHRFYLLTLSNHVWDVLQRPQSKEDCNAYLSTLMAKMQALHTHLRKRNPMAVFTNAYRNIVTGAVEDPGERWWLGVAKNMPVHMLKPGAVPKLRALKLVYDAKIEKLVEERRQKQIEIAALASQQRQTYQRQALDGILDRIVAQQGQAQQLCDDQMLTLQEVHRLKQELGLQDQQQQQQGDQTLIMDSILGDIERNFAQDQAERNCLQDYVFKEIISPLGYAIMFVACYPHWPAVGAGFPCMITFFLRALEDTGYCSKVLKQAPWVFDEQPTMHSLSVLLQE